MELKDDCYTQVMQLNVKIMITIVQCKAKTE